MVNWLFAVFGLCEGGDACLLDGWSLGVLGWSAPRCDGEPEAGSPRSTISASYMYKVVVGSKAKDESTGRRMFHS